MTTEPDIVERLRRIFTGWTRIDDLSEDAADLIEKQRTLLHTIACQTDAGHGRWLAREYLKMGDEE